VISLTTTFGIQNGHDRKLTAQIESVRASLSDIEAKAAKLMSRDLRTTDDYIQTYGELEPVLDEYDLKLRVLEDVIEQNKTNKQQRGPINIQRLYPKEEQWLKWDNEFYALLRQDLEVKKKQVAIVKQMAGTPVEDQVTFWKKNFLPLREDEDLLLQKLQTAFQSMPSRSN
jgi:hypothetical protein